MVMGAAVMVVYINIDSTGESGDSNYSGTGVRMGMKMSIHEARFPFLMEGGT